MAHPRLTRRGGPLAAPIALAVCAACAGSAGGPVERDVAGPPDVVATLEGGGARPVTSRRFDVRFLLPDGARWTVDDRRESWLVATHRAARSTLLLRIWRTPEVMNRERCERHARTGRALPALSAEASVLEEIDLGEPHGFDTRAVVALLLPDRPGGELIGTILAFGGDARRCLALVYETRDAGPGAERRIAERLGAVAHVTVRRLRVERELAPR